MPGMGFDVAHQATANFLTSDGKIYTGNLDVKGLGFALYGGGWLGYMNDTMNFPRAAEFARVAGGGALPGEQAVGIQFAGAAEQTRVASARVDAAHAARR